MGEMKVGGIRVQWHGGGAGRGWLGWWTWGIILDAEPGGGAVSYIGDHGSDRWVTLSFLMRKQKKRNVDRRRASQTSGARPSKLCLCRPSASPLTSLALAHSTWISVVPADTYLSLWLAAFRRHQPCLGHHSVSRSCWRIQEIPVNGSPSHPLPVLWRQKLKPREDAWPS